MPYNDSIYQRFPTSRDLLMFFRLAVDICKLICFRLFIVATGCPSERITQMTVSYYGG